MFYKHWKKFLLTITAFFWASCGVDSESTAPVNSPEDPDKIRPDDIDGTKRDTLYGIQPLYSSSSGEISSSDNCESCDNLSSSSEELPVPVYGVISCTPMDSSVTYFETDYSVETQKMWKEQEANRDAVGKIDSIKQTLAESPMCLEHLRMELDRFVALYGAPTIIMNAVDSCADGTIRPSEEYAKFLKMKEEWEANKPALEEELQKVYEDKMKEIEERINKCLSGEDDK